MSVVIQTKNTMEEECVGDAIWFGIKSQEEERT